MAPRARGRRRAHIVYVVRSRPQALNSGQPGEPTPLHSPGWKPRASAILGALRSEQAGNLQGQAEEHFGRHPDAGAYLSQPGIWPVPGARELGEFGGGPRRKRDGKASGNYAAASPLARAWGKKLVTVPFIHSGRLADALGSRAFAVLSASPGARAGYDELSVREIGHSSALKRLANRFAGMLRECLRTGALYDEATAGRHRETSRVSSSGSAFRAPGISLRRR